MKKSALALAVAAALTGFGSIAYADTTLYGSARVSVDYVDDDLLGNEYWDVWNNSSRLGVRGQEDLGGGLAAIYQYEFGVDVTEGGNLNSNRPKWVGLQGGFGAITAGTQWTPYYNVIGVGDIFNSSRAFSDYTYLGNAVGLRMDNSVIYTTPNLSGFSAQAMLVMNGSCEPSDPVRPNQLCNGITTDPATTNLLPQNLSDNIDMWNIGLSYKNGPFFAGATYMALEGPEFRQATIPSSDGDQWGLAFGYNSGPFAITFAYEDGDLNRLFEDDVQNYYLTGQYSFGPNVIRAAYGYVDPDSDKKGDDNIDNYILGYQYNFSKRTRVWLEYIGRTSDDVTFGDGNTLSIGTRVDF